MKKYLFESWKAWKDYFVQALCNVAKGLARMAYSVIMGLVSLLCASFLSFARAVRKYPVPSLIILCIVLLIAWLCTYVNLKSIAKTYEYQRDSIGYEMLRIRDTLGSDTIIIDKKIRHGLTDNF